jgi:hypothetical protein
MTRSGDAEAFKEWVHRDWPGNTSKRARLVPVTDFLRSIFVLDCWQGHG